MMQRLLKRSAGRPTLPVPADRVRCKSPFTGLTQYGLGVHVKEAGSLLGIILVNRFFQQSHFDWSNASGLQKFTRIIHLDQWPAEDPQAMIRTAVHNYFAHRAEITDLEFKRLLRRGRTSLVIGMLFLAACLFLSKMLLGREEGTWAAVLRESLTIAGWVAMWRPMEIYLYDWWPLLQLRRVFTKLSHMPVEVAQKGKS